MASHRRNYNCWKKGKKRYYTTSFEILKYDDSYIELIEECPCNDKNELNRREGQIIRSMDCVNKVKYVEGRNIEEMKKYRKEYHLENKEKHNKRTSEYYSKNKEKISEQAKQYRLENKEIVKQRKRKEYLKNREKYKERTRKYNKEHKEEIKIKNKKYREKNKEKFRQQEKVKATCECGSVLNKRKMWRHLKTIKHQTYIQSQSN